MNLKKRLQQGETLLGTLLSLPSPEIAEIMSQVGFDWLFIDLEHGPHGVLELQRMLQAMKPECSALVRVAELSEARRPVNLASQDFLV